MLHSTASSRDAAAPIIAPVPTVDRRGIVIIIVGLAANTALDLSGYESVRWAALAWLVAGIGVVYLLWPGLPVRLIDRARGERGWKAKPPVWEPGAGPRVLLLLQPPKGERPSDSVICEIRWPDERLQRREANEPGTAVTNGMPNDYYFAVVSQRDESVYSGSYLPLETGWYRASWYSTTGRIGRRLLRVRWFKIKDDGTLA
jgi:hypothetical protein